MTRRMPTRLDRYPAKMVSRLAAHLVERYASQGTSLLDPFAGSGAILVAARAHGMRVSGADINPISKLFTRVKLWGFRADRALTLLKKIRERTSSNKHILPIDWPSKAYWFTPGTLAKFEAIRGAISSLDLHDSNEKAAILLSLCLAVRLCSRADQRSPKPFISKTAIQERRHCHYDPVATVSKLLTELSERYNQTAITRADDRFVLADVAKTDALLGKFPRHSHVITSPPYLNAQDYFRNFKLELYVLEGLLPFRASNLKNRFIGTERGVLVPTPLAEFEERAFLRRIPQLARIGERSPRFANVVRRYFADMSNALVNIKDCLEPRGVLVLVCGDNLVAGERIKTWSILASMAENLGFRLFDSFADPIKDRLLPPKRLGHKGLIKKETVLAFRMG